MPTPTKGPRFGGSPSHQRLILANLAQNLIEHGRITTTEAKAKRLRPYVEHLITKAKTDTVANRRQVVKVIRDKEILHILFTEVGPAMATRPGGYTRIIKVAPRKGDNAPMAIIEIVEGKEFAAQNQTPKTKTPETESASTVAAPTADETADETAADETSGDAAVAEDAVADEPATSVDASATDESAVTEEALAAEESVAEKSTPDIVSEAKAEDVLDSQAQAPGDSK